MAAGNGAGGTVQDSGVVGAEAPARRDQNVCLMPTPYVLPDGFDEILSYE